MINILFLKRKKFIILQLLFFAIALSIYLYEKGNVPAEFILIYSIWNIISYIWLSYIEIKYAPSFHPFIILAFAVVQFLGVDGFNMYISLSNGENIYFGVKCINNIAGIGILALSLQHICIFASFFYFDYKKLVLNKNKFNLLETVRKSKIDYKSYAIRTYLFVWALRTASLFVNIGGISTILVSIAKSGHLISLMFLTFAMLSNNKKKGVKKLHWLIVAVEIILVLNHGMKQEIIQNLVPYAIYLVMSYKAGLTKINLNFIIRIGAIFAFIAYVVFPYISIFRSIANEQKKEWTEVSVEEVFYEYDKYIHGKGVYATDNTDRGLGYMLDRAGSISCNSWAIDYSLSYGAQPQFFKYCAIAFVPRMLWPDKPRIVSGGLLYRLSIGSKYWMDSSYVDTYSTSISTGFIGSCIFCFGILGGIFVLLFVSVFITKLWFFIEDKLSYHIVGIWMYISMLTLFLKDFEGLYDCGLNLVVFNIIYIIIIKKVFPLKKARRLSLLY